MRLEPTPVSSINDSFLVEICFYKGQVSLSTPFKRPCATHVL